MQAPGEEPMMNFIRENKCFTPSALCALIALLCLCFSLGVRSDVSSKISSENPWARVASGSFRLYRIALLPALIEPVA
jgi:hypothetical protein